MFVAFCGTLYQHSLTKINAWISDYILYLIFRYTAVEVVEYIVTSNLLVCVWLLIHTGNQSLTISKINLRDIPGTVNKIIEKHHNDVIMSMMASQITSRTIVYSTVYSGADQRKHQSSASLVFVREIHRWPVNSPHKGTVMRKMLPFDDVIMHIDEQTDNIGKEMYHGVWSIRDQFNLSYYYVLLLCHIMV